jgi:hypothetical protein
MPNPSFRRWTEDDIAMLKNMAQKHPSSTIVLRSLGALSPQPR